MIAAVVLAVCLMQACSRFEPAAPAADSILDGPVDGLSHAQAARFAAGDAAFNDDIFTPETGLGPIFVATSCAGCHAGDGKGHPFTTLTRFGQTDSTGNHYLDRGGPQLQNRAIWGYKPEEIPAGATFSRFTPPANTGLGYIELVPDADILAMADPNDLNSDGISGVPNWNTVPEYITHGSGHISQNGKFICRFGKKGAVFNLLQQTVNAYNQDMGIASAYNPYDVVSGTETDPEISTARLQDVVFYLQCLKAPVQRTPNDAEVQKGRQLFMNSGCGACHRESLNTGYSPVDALSYKTFYPYTDLLLHDMGPGLDDGYTEGSAKTAEWRTPPLWGLGLSKQSQGGAYYLMHDGRAGSIQDAILMHGGEAAASAAAFKQLSQQDRDALIKFLESL